MLSLLDYAMPWTWIGTPMVSCIFAFSDTGTSSTGLKIRNLIDGPGRIIRDIVSQLRVYDLFGAATQPVEILPMPSL